MAGSWRGKPGLLVSEGLTQMDSAFQTRGQIQTATNKNKHKKTQGQWSKRGRRGNLSYQAEGRAMPPGRVRQKEMYFAVGGEARGFLKK